MAEVISQTEIGPDLYKLKISAREREGRPAVPGQFCHLQVRRPESWDPLLRRPLSIYNAADSADYSDSQAESWQLEFVYQVRGRGTRLLSQFQPGEQIDYLGSLGSGFTQDFRGKNLILVGGGLGIAPLYFLARKLADINNLQVYLGASSAALLQPLAADIAKLDVKLSLATDDGSLGRAGTVFDILREDFAEASLERQNSNQPDYIFACGPVPLLYTLQKYMAKNAVPGEFSLEKRMACGSGVCLSCVCQTASGNQRVCYEGPVFPAREVIFNGS